MAVRLVEVRSRAPFDGGARYGDAGPYERIDGLVHFTVDPLHPANRAIVDLEKAERDAHGQVHFTADFCLLQPRDAALGNGRLLFLVANRGRVGAVPFSGAAYPARVDERIEPGDGFLLRRGWSVLWCGWQWDVVRRPGLVGLEAPEAIENGRPIVGQVRVEFQPNVPHPDQHLAHWPLHPPPGDPDVEHQPYPAADVDDPDAILTVREWADGPRTTIPRQWWRFARDDGGRPVADDTRIWLAGGFQPGLIYEVVYRTRICPIVGTGLLAARDAVSFFRYEDRPGANPSADRVRHTFAYGASQSGRFLRELLYHGLNLDEHGRRVFDGVHAHVGSARLGEFNQRYGQPSIHHTVGFAHRMPFSSDEQTDPVTGQRDGLLRRQRALGGVPRIITTNTASEYWYSQCSLIHTDLSGQRDLEPPPEERIYLLAGTRHNAGALPPGRTTLFDGRTANLLNVVDHNPLIRGLFMALDRWVTDGIEPPPSAFPRLADGTAVPREQAIGAFTSIPGVALPDPERLPTLRRVDLGPAAERGIGRYPPRLGEPFPSVVSAVDQDLNEVAGVRLPDISVPVGSHTGWNPRDPAIGGPGQIIDTGGSTFPFPADAGERLRSGDPRASIAERYRDHEHYTQLARAAADRLVDDGFLVSDDRDLVVRLAVDRYDAFAHRAAVAETHPGA